MCWRTRSDEKEKEESTFSKIENGLIYNTEYGIVIGRPTQIVTKTKTVREETTKTNYDWSIISGSPLLNGDVEKLKKLITNMSGTNIASFSNPTTSYINKCRKCGTSLFIFGGD